jgi:hypothetical protein
MGAEMEAGARIRFKHDIHEEATGDHPQFIMARKGELGTFVRKNPCRDTYPCAVIWDHCPHAFWCKEDEFEAV